MRITKVWFSSMGKRKTFFFLFHHSLLCCRSLDYTIIIFYIFMVFCYIILSVISGSTSKALLPTQGHRGGLGPSLVHMDAPDGQRRASCSQTCWQCSSARRWFYNTFKLYEVCELLSISLSSGICCLLPLLILFFLIILHLFITKSRRRFALIVLSSL